MVNHRFQRCACIAALTIFSLVASSEQSGAQKPITIANPSVQAQVTGQQPRRKIGAFFDKLRAGKPVTVAYFGGTTSSGYGASNPEKTSYRALVTDWLRDRYPKSEITEINASIVGTGSLYGALRARRDVIAFKPDLVFVDFAAGDVGEEELSVKKAVEGLFRQLLIVPQPPEVVALYTTNPKRNARAEWHESLAGYYQIPAVNLQDQTWAMIEAGKISTAAFWKDGALATDAGQKIFADLIISFLTEQEKFIATPLFRTLPPPLLSDEMNYGEFKAIAEIKHDSAWRLESNTDRALPTSLLYSSRPGAQIEYYFEGTVLGITFRMGPDCGIFEMLIDGKPAPPPLNRIDGYKNVNQIGARILAGGLGPGEHKLTIRILDDKNPRSSANNLRLGYLLIGGQRPERL